MPRFIPIRGPCLCRPKIQYLIIAVRRHYYGTTTTFALGAERDHRRHCRCGRYQYVQHIRGIRQPRSGHQRPDAFRLSLAQQYYIKPESMGGGGDKFTGITIQNLVPSAATSYENDNGTYALGTIADESVVLRQAPQARQECCYGHSV